MNSLNSSIPKINDLNNKTILVTGATGLIGSRIIETLIEMNQLTNLTVKIIASGRNLNRLEERFSAVVNENLFLWEVDMDSGSFFYPFEEKPNFIIHAASAANPRYYKEKPVETMTGNFLGCLKLLNCFSGDSLENFLFVSSGEVYGDFPTDIKNITEEMSGYIDSLDSRSCYPMSKRATETLCVSYADQYNQKVTIARPSHIFGPGFNEFDTRISAEFFRLALRNEDIIMKSSGEQLRSYTYIDDCVSGILCVLLNGKTREAYNVTNTSNEIMLRDFAQKIADSGQVALIFDKSSDKVGLQKTMSYASFSNTKLKNIGWKPLYDISQGIEEVFKQLNQQKD